MSDAQTSDGGSSSLQGQPPLFQPSVQSVPTGKEGDGSLEMVELRSGWMVKQGSIRKSWRRRFFVLQGGTLFGRLDYYKHERKGWKGAVSLKYAERAETIMTPPKVKNLYCFSIRTPTRVWLIGAESEDDRSTWIAAINAVLSHIRDPKASTLVIQPKVHIPEQPQGGGLGAAVQLLERQQGERRLPLDAGGRRAGALRRPGQQGQADSAPGV